MRHLLLLVLLAGSAQAGIISGGTAAATATAAAGGISTGAVTTSALTGDGQSTNPLGVNSSSVPVFDANRNLTVPYGVVASSGLYTNLKNSSGTVTIDGLNGGLSVSTGAGSVYPAFRVYPFGVGFRAELGPGTAAQPSLTWAIDPTSGWYQDGGALLRASISGTRVLSLVASGFQMSLNGSAASPNIAIDAAGNTGTFVPANGKFGVSCAGAECARFTASGLGVLTVADPATNLDVNGNAQFGSVKKSTVDTNGNVYIDAAAGVGQGTSIATMSVTGMLAFQSSSTISGSTFTASGTVLFGSYIMPANTLFKPGDAVEQECVFRNIGSISGGFQGGYMGGSLAYAQDNLASTIISVKNRITLVAAGTAMDSPVGARSTDGGNSLAITLVDNSVVYPFAFDATTSKTFQCEGRVTSGGTVNFMYMKVSKL